MVVWIYRVDCARVLVKQNVCEDSSPNASRLICGPDYSNGLWSEQRLETFLRFDAYARLQDLSLALGLGLSGRKHSGQKGGWVEDLFLLL